MFRKSSRTYRNKVEEGIFRLHAISLDTLQKIKTQLHDHPDSTLKKHKKQIEECHAIGDLLSKDWSRLSIQTGYRDPDGVMERLGVMLPQEILEWKTICEKLNIVTEIYDSLSAMRDMSVESDKVDLIKLEILPDLHRQLDEIEKMKIKKLKDLAPASTDSELVELFEKRAFLLEQIDLMSDEVHRLDKNVELYAVYNRAIGDIYTMIMSMQANPEKIKFPFDWLHTVCIQAIMQSSTDPASKQSLDATYKVVQSLESPECKGLSHEEKAFLLVKAVLADYENFHQSFKPSGKCKTSAQYLNSHSQELHGVRKLGLILKVMMDAYPDALPIPYRERIKALHLDELRNPYKNFLAHVELSSTASRKPSGSSGKS